MKTRRPYEKVAGMVAGDALMCDADGRDHVMCSPADHIEQTITREVNKAIRKAAKKSRLHRDNGGELTIEHQISEEILSLLIRPQDGGKK